MITYEMAKKYLDKGLSIFPVILTKDPSGKMNKKPAVPWKEYITRLPTDEELHQWFDTNNYNGIGMATGKISGINVLDVESYAKAEDVQDISSPVIVSTISGGFHYYFKWTKEIRNTVKIKNKAIDFRGDGGFVVLPPSGSFGQKYKWKTWDWDHIVPLPTYIEEELQAPKQIMVKVDLDADFPYPPAVSGQRNSMAAQVSGSILSHMSKKIWESAGWVMLQEWNNRNPDPLAENELRSTFESVMRTRMRNNPEAGMKTIEDLFQVIPGKDMKQEYEKKMGEFGGGLTTGFETLDKYFAFLPEQLYLVSGPTTHGKTTFALNMCGRIAALGHKVLFISLEMGIWIQPRVEATLGGFYPENLDMMVTSQMATIENIVERVKMMEEKPKLLCIDHLHFLEKSEGASSKADEVERTVQEVQNMAKELKIPVIAIAHTRKLNEDRAPGIDDLKDSSALGQTPAVVMLVYRDKYPTDSRKQGYDSLKAGTLKEYGFIQVAKNRIRGEMGVIPFKMERSGLLRINDVEGRTTEELDGRVIEHWTLPEDKIWEDMQRKMGHLKLPKPLEAPVDELEKNVMDALF